MMYHSRAYLVGESRDHTALDRFTVTFEIEVAALWWAVFRVYHFITLVVNSISGGVNDYTAHLTDKMPALSKRLTLPNSIRPNSSITNIEGIRGFEEILDELRSFFGEEVLGQIADGAMAETSPLGCLTREDEDGERN